MPEDLEARLRALEEREAIRELRATYCFLVDDGRYDELVESCFTKDALCDFGAADGSLAPMRAEGREEVRAFFSQAVASLLRDMSHTVHNHRITIDGDQASGDCYFELTATDAASGDDVMGAGRYVDRYRREGGRWRFAERRAEIFFMTPREEGWNRRRFIATLAEWR
jgi:ketosteroid isomerase-like protein